MEEHLKAQEKPNYAYFGRVELPKLLTKPTSNGVTALGNAQVTVSGVRDESLSLHRPWCRGASG